MDPDNPVVKLCAHGMELESKGDHSEAASAFISAWDQSSSDLERCIAAHYVARHQPCAADVLIWNERSLEYAQKVDDAEVRGFYPSLYLNMGKANEDLGNREEAKRFYEMAATVLGSLPDERYSDLVRDAVNRALARVS